MGKKGGIQMEYEEYETPECYRYLFNAVESAIQAIEEQNYGTAKEILLEGELKAELSFVEEGLSEDEREELADCLVIEYLQNQGARPNIKKKIEYLRNHKKDPDILWRVAPFAALKMKLDSIKISSRDGAEKPADSVEADSEEAVSPAAADV